MKKFILSMVLVFTMLTGYSQDNPFKGFWGPVEKSLYTVRDRETGVITIPNFWLARPFISLSAIKLTLKSPVQVSPTFSSFGTGISYSHFTEKVNEPYDDFGFNALILFENNTGGVEPINLSFAVTASALQYINIGIGYSIGDKSLFALMGISYNFNKPI